MIKYDLGFVPPSELSLKVFVVFVLKLFVFFSDEEGLLALCECFLLYLETEASRRRYWPPLAFLKTAIVNSFDSRPKLSL